MPADDIDTERLYDDVQTYMEHVQQGLSLAWYAFHALQSKYKMEEAGDGTVYVGGRDTYPSADELYARYRPAREVHERREDAAYIGEDRGKDGRVSSEAPAVLPSAPRIQLRVPSLASYAEAYNELAEDAGIGDGLRAYIADAVGDEVEELVAVHEFLDTLPADTDHEEDILDRADGLAPGIADRVADVIAALSGRYEDVDDLPLRFENDVVGNNLFSGLGMLMELEGRDVDITGRLQDRVRSEVEERYKWTGTMTKEVYRDGESVYVLPEDADRFERVDDARAALPLPELVRTYDQLTELPVRPEDREDARQDIQEMMEVMRELYRIGTMDEETVEVFYDSRTDTVVLNDRATIDFGEVSDTVHWLDGTRLDPGAMRDDATIRWDIPLFDQVADRPLD